MLMLSRRAKYVGNKEIIIMQKSGHSATREGYHDTFAVRPNEKNEVKTPDIDVRNIVR
jgi:hypothetical protein